MKSFDLLQLIGDIDDKIVLKYLEKRRTRITYIIKKISAIAACLVIVASIMNGTYTIKSPRTGVKQKEMMINGKKIVISGNRTYIKPESLSVSSSGPATSERSYLEFYSEDSFADKLKKLDFSPAEEAVIYSWMKTENGILLCPLDHYYKLKSVPEGYKLNCIYMSSDALYGYILTGNNNGTIICTYNPYDSYEAKKEVFDFGATLEKVKKFYGTDNVTERSENINSIDISVFDIKINNETMRVEAWQYKKSEISYLIVNLYGTEEMYKSRSIGMDYDRKNPISSRILVESEGQSFIIMINSANIPIDNQFAESFNFIRTNIK